jgi:hypothetical protein
VLEEHAGEEDSFFRLAASAIFDVPADRLTGEHLLMANSMFYLSDHEEALARPGWTILASDFSGMPWLPDPRSSHGTWAAHDVCGTVQKLTAARAECRVCPPEPDSRTHRAKRDQPQLLYLVRYHNLLKFGHGDTNRVRAHLRAGCKAIQVLRAPHEQVVAAELQIRRRFRARIVDPHRWPMPTSFGVGSEVVDHRTAINLSDFLAGPDVADVTGRWTR